MTRDLAIEAIHPSELSVSDLALWRLFRDGRPELESPYFDPRYALAAGQVCPNALVGVIRSHGEVMGFLPFQRRGKLIQPLGAPLTDYHGVVSRAGVAIDPGAILHSLGMHRFRFSGLHACARIRQKLPSAGVIARKAMVADLGDGFDAWVEARRGAGQSKFFKDKRRRRSRLERDVGPISFTLDYCDDATFDHVLNLKREQLAVSGQHDIFQCGWTERLLHGLKDNAQSDFGLRMAVLKAGHRIVAAELGLRSGGAYHLWFPVYDPQLASYSPGQLMTIETLRAAAAQGIRRVDFGPGGESYKRAFAEPAATVFEGDVLASPAREALARTPGLRNQRLRLGRRLDRIIACEPALAGRTRALVRSAASIISRPFAQSAA